MNPGTLHFGILPDLGWLTLALPLLGVLIFWIRDVAERMSTPGSKETECSRFRRLGEVLGIVEPDEPPYLKVDDQDSELRRRYYRRIELQNRDCQPNKPRPGGFEQPRIGG